MVKKTMKRNTNRLYLVSVIISILGLFAFSGILSAAEFEFKASINADKIGIDDILLYTITLKGDNNPTQPTLSDLTDFRVAQTSRNTEFRFVNGVSTYYTNFVYYLRPLKTGTLTIGPVTYHYDGKDYKTQPFKINVVKGSIAPANPRRRNNRFPSIFDDDDFFNSPFRRQQKPRPVDVALKIGISTKKAVKGEPVIYRVLLYSRNTVQSVNMISNQSFPGFWQEWFPVPRSIGAENKMVDGKMYQVYEIRKAVLFPTKTGKVTIPSLQFDITLLDGSRSAFFAQPRNIRRGTPEVTVDVSPLPTQALGLPVGKFTFRVTADKKEVDINDILTLKIKIVSNKGNIKTIEIPLFKSGESFKVFPPKTSKDTNYDDGWLTGIAKAEVPVSFKKTGTVSFPELAFRYYDPEQKKVVTLKSKPFNVKVTGVKEKQENSITIPQTDIVKKGEDIDFIKKGNVSPQGKLFYKSQMFTVLLVVFFLFNLLYLLKITLYDRYVAGSAMLKNKKLLSKTLGRLRNVKDYGEISPILEDYLSQKAGLGLSEINNNSIAELLSKNRVNDSDVDRFVKIKSAAELHRFAPQQSGAGSGGARDSLAHDLKQLIEILKRIDGRLK